MYLIDTDIVVFAIKGNQMVLERLEQLAVSDWSISSITAFEVQKGIEANPKSKSSARAALFLAALEPKALGKDSAIAAARVHQELKAKGITIGTADELLAGQAIALGATIVTNNTKHFDKVTGLKRENWL